MKSFQEFLTEAPLAEYDPSDVGERKTKTGKPALNKKGETGSYSIQNGFSMTQYDKTGNVNYDSPYFHKQG